MLRTESKYSPSTYVLLLTARTVHSEDATRAWAQLAKEWYTYELGHDSQQVQQILGILEKPRSHVMWRTRGREEVGHPGRMK